MSSICINEIETLFKLVIEKLKKDNIDNIQVNIDEYWIILTDKWANFKVPPKPAVGSLKEDVHFLKKSIEEKEIFSYSDFDRLATLLRVISEMQAPSD